MHTFGDTGVPAFLAKLWRLVDDEETNDLISWNSDGRSFIIQNQARFAKELLPLNYKHNNMASFIRQLNMYGFHKIASIDNGGLKFDRDEMEFSHPCFQQGHPYLLEHIKRKIAHPKGSEDKVSTLKVEAVNHVLNEVKTMRGRQDSMDSRFSSIKQENEALWREVAILRQKHIKQQQIVNKLIQFLVTIVQPQRTGLGAMNKRHYQLMINDTPKSAKMEKDDTGPIIHELTEELLESTASDNEQDDFPHVQSPYSGGSTRSRNTSGTYLQDEDIDVETEATPPKKPKMVKSDSTVESEVIDYVVDYDLLVQEGDATTVKPDTDYNEEKLRKQLQHRQKQQQEMLKLEQQQQRDQLEQEFRHQHEQTEINQFMKKETAGSSVIGKKVRLNANKRLIIPPVQPGKSLLIKQEKEAPKITVDPMSFINMMEEGTEVQPTTSTSIVASAVNVDDPQHDASVARIEEFLKDVTAEEVSMDANGKNMYTKDSFMTNEMPSELFDDGSQVSTEDSPMLGGINLNGGAYNPNLHFKQEQAVATTSSGIQDEQKAIIPKLQTNHVHPEKIMRFNSRNDIDNHLNTVETDLDTLKDLLRGDGYQFDANSLLGHPADNNARPYYLPQSAFDPDTIIKLFGNDDILSYEMSSPNNQRYLDTPSGSELISYQPCQADLSDLLNLDENGTPIDYNKATSVPPANILGEQ